MSRSEYGLNNKSKVALADLNANIVSTLQCGCFVGALVASWTADRFGRRKALMFNAVITIIGCVFQAAGSGKLAVMFIGRFIAGLGVGAASMITPLYVAENSPRAIRGGLTGLYQLFIATGTMLAFWTNYGSLQHLKGDTTFIVPLAAQALPAIALLVCIFFCKESTRWLAKADRWEDATKTLSVLRQLPTDHPYVQGELQEMADQLEHERRLIGGASFWDLQKEMWKIPGNRKRALISIGLMICQQMTGTNAINYYAPQIFESLGITGTSTGLFATGIYGIVKMVTCAAFLLFAADSLGRRRSLLWTSIAQGCAMFYVGLYVRIEPPVKGEPVPPAGYFALVCIFLFAAFFQVRNPSPSTPHHPPVLPSPAAFPAIVAQKMLMSVILSVRLGPLLLDLRLRDPDRAAPVAERGHRGRDAVALQPGRRARHAQHDRHGRQGRLRLLPHLRKFLFQHVLLRLVLHSRD